MAFIFNTFPSLFWQLAMVFYGIRVEIERLYGGLRSAGWQIDIRWANK